MRPEPVFEAPWHAQIFAITLALHDRGLFDWPHWGERFGATLKRHGLTRELDGGDDYFAAWLEALEGLLQDQGLANLPELERLKAAWETAYLTTPHGAPVVLGKSSKD